jgi:hypothetical protein
MTNNKDAVLDFLANYPTARKKIEELYETEEIDGMYLSLDADNPTIFALSVESEGVMRTRIPLNEDLEWSQEFCMERAIALWRHRTGIGLS